MAPKTRSQNLRDHLKPTQHAYLELKENSSITTAASRHDAYLDVEELPGLSTADSRLRSRLGTIPGDPFSRKVKQTRSITEDPFSGTSIPPVYTIDLSLPPAQRYVQVARDFLPAIVGLPALFDEIIEELPVSPHLIHFLARTALRRLHSNEQTEELRGINKVTGVPMYLLVAFNVLLDLFMGCTSGAVRSKEHTKDEANMLHFRTLDWDMPALKMVIVQFEFRERKAGPVIASAINYVGYVGMLTAVRKGLSISLNFRASHSNDDSLWTNVRFRTHQLAVLLGFRPSIAAYLRDLIIPTGVHQGCSHRLASQTLPQIARYFPSIPTTSAFLVFCDGKRALLLEKDRVTAKPLVSGSFLVTTNHDVSDELSSQALAARRTHAEVTAPLTGMQEIIAESVERKNCMVKKWERRCRKLAGAKRVHPAPYVRLGELKAWVQDSAITTPGQTHFSTIMDPSKGTIEWVRIVNDEEFGGEEA